MAKLVLLAAVAALAAINVPLEVSNWADAARTGEPVTAGVPLPEKGVYDLSRLRITDASGNTLPAQFKALSRWYREKHRDGVADPSIKWVLCDFQADVAAKNKTAVFLKDDNAAGAPSTDLTLVETASDITVVTGPLKFVISKTRFNLFDEAWLDANGNQSYETSEKIFAAGNNSGGFVTAGDWSAGECIDGTMHTTLQSPVDRVVIEENGPMKVLIRVEGRHFAAVSGVSRGLYGYQVFITAYAGKPYVDVQWAVTNLYLEGDRPRETGTPTPWTMYSWPFKTYTLSLDLNLNAAATQSGALLPDNEATFTAGNTPSVLDQRFRHYTCTGGASGTAAKGAASLSDNSLGVRVAMRIFGPNAPKTLAVSKNKIDIGLFPDTGNTVPYYLEAKTRKNHRMRFEFFSGTPAAGALSALWNKNDAPLRMLATNPAWYRNTNAWERGFGVVPGYARTAPAGWTRLDRMATYPGGDWAWQLARACWQYGGLISDQMNYNSGGDHLNLTSCFWKYLLTGNPEDFEEAENEALYFNDRTQEQYPYDAWQKLDFFLNPMAHLSQYDNNTHGIGGLGQNEFIEVSAFPGYSGTSIPDDGHMTQLQEIEYYQLTGDPATLDAMKGLAVEAAAFGFERTYIWRDHSRRDSVNLDSIYTYFSGPRYTARPAIVCMHAYDMTGDERYRYAAQLPLYGLANRIKRHPVGYLAYEGEQTYCDPDQNPWATDHPGIPLPAYYAGSDFQIGIGHEALYSYWLRTGDERIRDALVFAGKSMTWRMGFDSLGRYTGFIYSGWSDYGWSGKRYAPGIGQSYGSSSAEGFGGLIFSYLASGDSAFWRVCTDGWANWQSHGSFLYDLKAINLHAAIWKHDSTDITPPAAVSDLAAATQPDGRLLITWTAPAGAVSYQVKAAKSPIVDMPDRWNGSTNTGWPDLNDPLPYTGEALLRKTLNFTATQAVSFWGSMDVAGEPAPSDGGAQESMVLAGLYSNTSYHVALVSWDSAGNVSALSNVAAGATGAETGRDGKTGFVLLGNTPNPFNPSTAIRYHVPASMAGQGLSLCVYDVRGKLVRILFQGPAKAGLRTVTWESRAASGLYLLRLAAGNEKIEKRMILVK